MVLGVGNLKWPKILARENGKKFAPLPLKHSKIN